MRYAVQQARLTKTVVEAVIAWDYPTAAGCPLLPLPDDFEGTFGETLAGALAQISKDEPDVGAR
ncbi:hypothetical protein GCM10010329_77760 [Streptomyces spiroverticillatus]|uniref:Uncharacterized protein n=1 Tax=Streptomyces finlayi TaxID=67296 RepID=A0A919CDR6_9ACTN|nr:hypothetical protein GCM10010329_77760 [Streptomyces spiroverticillatus]GHD13425.1 hypothetical protein GCM10010334_71590 [Streptomyces finlayi]